MRYVASRDEMQRIDAYSIQTIGIPGLVLMEKAAMAMEKVVCERFDKKSRILIVTEKGNNGGDGLALGRMLLADGYLVDLVEIGGLSKASDSYTAQRDILKQLEIPVYGVDRLTDDLLSNPSYDLVVDAIFGVGLKREVEGIWASTIKRLNAMEGVKLAVDLPSGVDASTGKVLGTAFEADITVTFGLSKVGLLLYPGAALAGEVIVADIGFPKKAVDAIAPKAICYDESDLRGLPERRPDSHKGTYGRVLLIAGSKNMSGAAFLAGKAAYRMGSGLVRIFTCEENRQILQTQLPEAIMTTYTNQEEALALLPEAIRWASVIGFGSGLGQSELGFALLKNVLLQGREKKPLVLDADGLNLLARYQDRIDSDMVSSRKSLKGLYEVYGVPIIITPHLMEMSRLLGCSVSEIKEDLIKTAKDFADEGHIVVLKDARTIVSDGGDLSYINSSGNHGMSVGGSGDVLCGILCGLLAGSLAPLEAARLGVYLHGLAGDRAVRKKGYYGLMASEIADGLADVIH